MEGLEAAGVLLAMHYDTRTTPVTTVDDRREVTGVELDQSVIFPCSRANRTVSWTRIDGSGCRMVLTIMCDDVWDTLVTSAALRTLRSL